MQNAYLIKRFGHLFLSINGFIIERKCSLKRKRKKQTTKKKLPLLHSSQQHCRSVLLDDIFTGKIR